MQIKAIIFDIGGVLAYDVWEHLFLDSESGLVKVYQLNQERVRLVGQELWNKFAYNISLDENDWRELEKKYWDQFIDRIPIKTSLNDFIQLTNRFIRPVEGMIPLLEFLQSQGFDLAICSNNTDFWLRRQMEQLDLDRFFTPNKIVISTRIGVPKSSPEFEMFDAVIHALGKDKTQCILVDDRAENIEQAVKYGLAAILFPSHSKYGHLYLSALLRTMTDFR